MRERENTEPKYNKPSIDSKIQIIITIQISELLGSIHKGEGVGGRESTTATEVGTGSEYNVLSIPSHFTNKWTNHYFAASQSTKGNNSRQWTVDSGQWA